MKPIDRREFIRTMVLGSAGLWISAKLAPFSALASVPWEKQTDSILLGEETKKIDLSPMYSPSKGIKNEYPAVGVDDTDTVWMCWIEELPDGEEVRLSSFSKNTFSPPTQITQKPSFAVQPEMLLFPGGGVIVWTQFVKKGVWKVMARILRNGVPQKLLTVSETEAIAWKPSLARDSQNNIWIVWEEKSNNYFQIKARILKDDRLSRVIQISEIKDKDNCRPAIAPTKDGKVWIAWDRLDSPGNANIIIRQLSPNEEFATKEIPVTHTAGLDVAPSVAVDSADRLWIAWHSNRWGKEQYWDVPRWFRLVSYAENQFYEPVAEPPGKSNELSDTVQSFEFVNVYCTSDNKVLITGRASHNFFLQFYQGSQWSPIYRFPKDGWGGRGQYLKLAEDKQGNLWVVRRDLGSNVLQRLSLPKKKTSESPQLKAKLIEPVSIIVPNAPEKPVFDPWGEYNFYFGDIHGHTWMSDGVGDVDEYFISRRDFYKLDFAALTDHDTFVGNGLIPSEWEYIKEITTHFNEPHHFVTLYGQEWTTARWPKGFGHKNIYHIDPEIPLFDHTDEATNTTQRLFAKVKEIGAIAIPHHIGWTGVDWENHDPAVQPLVEIVSVHGAFEYMGNNPIPHRGGKPGCFVQDGLARGLRFGIVGGSDSHGLIWHHRVCYKRDPNRAGWTCVLAKELTRQSIWEALRNRRCYATSGIWMRMFFQINGHIIGEEFETTEKPTIEVDVNAESELKWIQIVRNNQTIYSYGGEGFRSRFTFVDNEPPAGISFYYLRVICEDNNMGWSSPIWVDYKG